MEGLSETSVLSTFDELVQEGIITYGPHERVEKEYEGFPMEFRICPSLTKKPQMTTSALTTPVSYPRWGPGSDLYLPTSRLILGKLNGGTHDLALNMFCVDRPQFMLLTTDSYRRQTEPLDADDFAAALEAMRQPEWGPQMYVIYNCTERGGCSRLHKHLQALKGPPRAFGLFVESVDEGDSRRKVPFQYLMHRFERGLREVEVPELLGVYEGYVEESRHVLGLSGSQQPCPHNVVLWRDSLVVIPRRSDALGGVSTNTVGMMGSVWVHQREMADEWIRLGPRKVLEAFGVPW
ncbi:uncharacterized protein EI97DRAFT_380411 [Westerdykella ornata]|uniref:Uncharacterized protein n=1 Tax=Westerdykella ornata TaxID=318751 RepID=A0A6A6JET0_WESOR|nr:uncharacterized protein EI97DRAFT_380411 [Westerdykella ornata]KAF2274775.1 hypothetical protein EI97DRAFT_380411 [Westerdykella ornata]